MQISHDVSVFLGLGTDVAETVALPDMIDRIRTGVYRRDVDQVRRLVDVNPQAAKSVKRALTAFTPACALATRKRNVPWDDKLLSVTGLVHLDLDGIDDVCGMQARFARVSHVVFVFRSPSGTGLKVGIAATGIIDAASYKHAWRGVSDAVQSAYPEVRVSTDEHVSYLHALCFVSYDPEAVYRADASPIVVPSAPLRAMPRSHGQSLPTDMERLAQMLEAIQDVDDYNTWIKVGMALHSTGAPEALDLWDQWSQRGDSYDPAAVHYHWGTFQTHGAVHLGTLVHLAQQHGWREPRRASATEERSGTAEALDEEDQGEGGAADVLPYSDYTNAVAFLRQWGQDVRYCPLWNSWMVWNGRCWERDLSSACMRMAKATVKRFAHRLAAMDAEEDAKAMSALLKHLKASLATSKLESLLKNAQSEEGVYITPQAFDALPWLLNCANGTLDLRTGALRAHARQDLLSHCLDTPYDPQAGCPQWLAMLAHALDHNMALLTFLQRAIGYSLTGSTDEQCLFLLWGGGSNGKGTILNTIKAMLGTYARQTDPATFLQQPNDKISNDLAVLASARLVCTSEVSENRRLSESLVKQVTGNDTVSARFLFQEFFEYVPQFKLFIATNHKPVIRGTDHAIWRRMRLIPFTVTIPDEAQDKQLGQKLRQEWPGILAWAVQGCLDWQRDGLQAPEAVTSATAEYRAEMDVVGRFLEERTLASPHAKCVKDRFYRAYGEWCKESGEEVMSKNLFGKRLLEKSLTESRSHGGVRFWMGIDLTATENAHWSSKEDDRPF